MLELQYYSSCNSCFGHLARETLVEFLCTFVLQVTCQVFQYVLYLRETGGNTFTGNFERQLKEGSENPSSPSMESQ